MSNSKDSKLTIEELNIVVKSLKDATHISLVELEKNIQFTHQVMSQFDTRLKQLENSMKFVHNTFQKNGKNGKNEKNIEYKCDN